MVRFLLFCMIERDCKFLFSDQGEKEISTATIDTYPGDG